MSFGFGAGANARKKFRRAAPKEAGTETLDINKAHKKIQYKKF